MKLLFIPILFYSMLVGGYLPKSYMNNKDNSLGLTDINIAILYFKQTRFLLSEGWKRTNMRTENKDHHMGYRHSLCGVLRKKSLLGYSKQV